MRKQGIITHWQKMLKENPPKDDKDKDKGQRQRDKDKRQKKDKDKDKKGRQGR
jgi:hypothetical protein